MSLSSTAWLTLVAQLAKEVASGVIEEFGTKGMEAAIGRLFSGSTIPQAAIRGGMIEGGQELVQNLVARASAGEDLASADAYKEYLASGVTGAFLGGGIGAVDVGIRRLQSSDPESLFGGIQTEEQRKKNVKASDQRRKDNTTVINDAFNAEAEECEAFTVCEADEELDSENNLCIDLVPSQEVCAVQEKYYNSITDLCEDWLVCPLDQQLDRESNTCTLLDPSVEVCTIRN